MTDEQLLSQFCQDRSEAAMTALVNRHLGWVRSVASRGLGLDGAATDDVSQAVFIALAEKACYLNGRTHVAGWLFRATRYTVAHVRRAERGRRIHERKAAAMSDPTNTAVAQWMSLAPVLDEMVAALAEKDRRLVLSRFYERKSFAEAGSEIGISEEAARARVGRAINRLRAMFAKRGVTAPAVVALVALIEDHVAAPASAESNLAAVRAACDSNSARSASELAQQTLRAMAVARLIWIAASAAIIAASLALGAGLFGHFLPRHAPVAMATTAPAVRAAIPVVPATPPPAVNEELKLPGETDLARWDLILTPDAGEALADLGQPIDTDSQMYQGMIVNGDALRKEIVKDEADGQVVSIPEDMHINGHWGEADAMNPIELEGAIDFGYPRSATVGMMQSLGPASEAATPIDSNHLHLVMSHGPTNLLIITEGPAGRNQSQRWVQGAKLGFDGTLEAGQAAAFVGMIAGPSGRQYAHLVVWETFKATAKQFGIIQNQRDPKVWIGTGPAKMRGWADAAKAWAAGAPSADSLKESAFTRTLSDGKIVRLVAVARFDRKPFCWWDPAGGKPVAFDGYYQMHADASDKLVVAIEQTSTPDRQNSEQPPCVPNHWFEGYMPQAIDEHDTAVDVGISVGDWHVAADLKAGEPKTIGSATYRVADDGSGNWERTGVVDDQEEMLSAVDRNGKDRSQRMAKPIVIRRVGDKPATSADGMIGLPSDMMASYRLWYRKREWVRFDGFKNNPMIDGGGKK